jgi:hypothetical protein
MSVDISTGSHTKVLIKLGEGVRSIIGLISSIGCYDLPQDKIFMSNIVSVHETGRSQPEVDDERRLLHSNNFFFEADLYLFRSVAWAHC